MLWRLRSLWGALAVVLYAGVASLQAQPEAPRGWLGLIAGPALLLLAWKLVDVPVRGPDRIEPAARSAARVVVSAAVTALVAGMAPDTPAFAALRYLAVGASCVASSFALVRVGSLGGIAARPERGRHVDAAVYAALLWTITAGLAIARAIGPTRAALVDAIAVDYAAVAASLGSHGIGIVAALRLYSQRRFELGVSERAAASLWLGVLCLALGVFATLLSVARAEWALPASALGAACCVTVASISQRPALVSRVLRTTASVTMLCAPVLCVAVVVAYKRPTHAGAILFMVTAVAALLGLLAPRFADQLAPERGRWLRALDAALVAAQGPEPGRVLADVLVAIRDGLPRDAEQATLHRLASRDRIWVDRAGYLHVEAAEIPERLLEVAEQEPERVLSTEALRYVQVRRPDVRPLVDWLDARGCAATVLVLDEDVCVGALLWPAAGRATPLSFEEVRAMRRLAGHLGAGIGAASQLARSRARELEAEQAVAAARADVSRLRDDLARDARRHRSAAEAVARPVRVACYSAAAQGALSSAERMGASGQPVGLVVPPGVAAAAWAAVVHLASPRSSGVLLVVDAAEDPGTVAPATGALGRWMSPSDSPLALARGGTLVLLDAQVLPGEVQRFVANALPDATGLVVAVPATPDDLLAAGRLEPHLAERLRGRVLALPPLLDRAEDLRALALYKLSRIGLRLRAEPLGLSMQAQALLNEHSWPGNDAELDAVLLRAALAATGPVVEAAELASSLAAQHGS